jgi:ABC-type transport system substrate-binding protein
MAHGGAVVFLALLLSVPACAPKEPGRASAAQNQPRPGGTLRVMHEPPRTLDPVSVDDVYEGTVVNQVFEGLVGLNADLCVLPCLAESWVVSDDGRLYRFTLRSGISFHDGRPLRAEDVIRTFHRALDPHKEQPCLAETYLVGIEGAEAFKAGRSDHISGLWVDPDGKICLRLKEPLSFFLSVLSMDQVKIVPAPRPGDNPDLHPIGTGPFRFVERSEDGTVVLARNEHYWGKPALIDTLRFIASTHLSDEEAVAKLLRHEVDVVPIGGSHKNLVGEVAGYRILRSPDIGVTFLGLNTRIPPLDRLEVRQAIASVIDRPKLISPEASAFIDVATGVLPPRLAGYHPTPKILSHDPDKARALLAAAGYDAGHPLPPIDFWTNVSSTKKLETELSAQMAEVGIRLRVHELTWPELDGMLTAGQAGLFTLSWIADVPDPDAFLYFLFRSGEPNNLFAFADAEVDSLLDLGRRMPPGQARFAIYRQAEARVLGLAPMIPLYNGSTLYAWNPDLQGVEVNQFGFALTPFEKVWFALADARADSPEGSTP